MDFKGRKVLVVGGAGYVGSVLTTLLLDAGAEVRVLDQLIYDNGFALQHLLDNVRLSFVRGDMSDPATFARAAAGMNDVVLLASLVGDPICKKYSDLATRVNQRAAMRIIDSLDVFGIKRFVFASTCSNYGIHDPARWPAETAELNPQSLYAKTKIEVEQQLLDVLEKLQLRRNCAARGHCIRVFAAHAFRSDRLPVRMGTRCVGQATAGV